MPIVTNNAPRLCTFNAIGDDGKRLNLVPLQSVELAAAQCAKLYRSDVVFKAMVQDGSVVVEGWSPDDASAASVAPPVVATHAALPSAMLDPAATPSDPEPVPVEPIEPTPNAGVPGNAKQAKETVAASNDPSQLAAWEKTESRVSVLRAIEARMDALATPDDADESEVE